MLSIQQGLIILFVTFQSICKCTPREINRQLQPQTPAQDRILPPAFPFWGPFGFFSSALLCPFIAGPYPGMKGRACFGPAPPFLKKPPSSPPPPPLPVELSTPAPPSDDAGEEVEGDEEELPGDEEMPEYEEEELVEYRPRKKKKCKYYK